MSYPSHFMTAITQLWRLAARLGSWGVCPVLYAGSRDVDAKKFFLKKKHGPHPAFLDGAFPSLQEEQRIPLPDSRKGSFTPADVDACDVSASPWPLAVQTGIPLQRRGGAPMPRGRNTLAPPCPEDRTLQALPTATRVPSDHPQGGSFLILEARKMLSLQTGRKSLVHRSSSQSRVTLKCVYGGGAPPGFLVSPPIPTAEGNAVSWRPHSSEQLLLYKRGNSFLGRGGNVFFKRNLFICCIYFALNKGNRQGKSWGGPFLLSYFCHIFVRPAEMQ